MGVAGSWGVLSRSQGLRKVTNVHRVGREPPETKDG